VVANQTPREHIWLSRYLAEMPVVRIARVPLKIELESDVDRTESRAGSFRQAERLDCSP
jgi:hypothetical protein